MLFVALLVALSLCCAAVSAVTDYSVNGAHLAGVASKTSEATAMKRLSNGDLIVGGSTTGAIGAGNTNVGLSDWVLQRLTPSGSAFTVQWTKMLGSTGDDYISSIAIDNSDNIYVTGGCKGAFDGNTYTSDVDICYAKFDKDGNKIWSNQAGGTGGNSGANTDYAEAILIDSSQNYFYMVGYMYSKILYGKTKGVSNNNGAAFLAKYDAATGANLACTLYGTIGTVEIYNGVIDSQNNIYFVGSSSASDYLGQPRIGSGGWDAVYTKVTSDGTHLFSGRFGGTNNDFFWAAALDDQENLYMTGYGVYDSNGFYPTGNVAAGVKYATSSQLRDIALVKVTSTGSLESITLAGGTNLEEGNDIAVDSANDIVYVTGYTKSTLYGDTAATADLGSTYIMQFSTNGTRLNSNVLRSSVSDLGNAIVLRSPSEIYIAGQTSGSYGSSTRTGTYDLSVLNVGAAPEPTTAPTLAPSATPTISFAPTPSSQSPTVAPTLAPSVTPTIAPSVTPTIAPTVAPSVAPTIAPSVTPTITPSAAPSVVPTLTPTAAPSIKPTAAPSYVPTIQPSASPTFAPTTLDSFVVFDIVVGGVGLLAFIFFCACVLKCKLPTATFNKEEPRYVTPDHAYKGEIEIA